MNNELVISILVVFVIFLAARMLFQRKSHVNTYSKNGLIISIISLVIPLVKEYLDKRQSEKKYNVEEAHYRKKQYFLTQAEHHVFDLLLKTVGEKYHVFPQVHYSKIMYAEGQQNFHNPWFNKIDRKSADFVLFDKQDISPVLVIEQTTKPTTDPTESKEMGLLTPLLSKAGYQSCMFDHLRAEMS